MAMSTTTVWFENSNYSRGHENAHAILIPQPTLAFLPSFSNATWFTDPFVLFQNGIRHETQDLYIMLRSASLCMESLRSSDALALQTWLVDYSQFVSLYFLVQERIIYPQVFQKGGRIRFGIEDLKTRTKSLIQALVLIHRESVALTDLIKAREDKRVLNFSTSLINDNLSCLSKLVATFVTDLEDMFSWEIKEVAYIIKVRMHWEQTRNMERRCIMEILRQGIGEKLFAGYLQWIPTRTKEYYLSGIDMLKMTRLRRKERKWYKTHKTLQTRFGRIP